MRKIILLLFMIAFSFFSIPSIAHAANWQWITSTETVGFFVDIDSIKKEKASYSSDTTYYRAWIKYVFNQGGIQETIKLRVKCNLPIGGFENLSHSILREECKYEGGNKYSRIISRFDYNSAGKVLDSDSSYMQFHEVVPDTIGETIYNAVVKNS